MYANAFPRLVELYARICLKGCSKAGFTIVSLSDAKTVRHIFKRIGHTSGARREIRRAIFNRIARSPHLQQQVLHILAKHPKVQQKILLDLAQDPRLRRKLLELAESQS